MVVCGLLIGIGLRGEPLLGWLASWSLDLTLGVKEVGVMDWRAVWG